MKTPQEFEDTLKGVYDNLTKEQFQFLLERCRLKILYLMQDENLLDYSNKDGFSRWDGKTEEDIKDVTIVASNVYITVKKSRRISYKQFKMLSLLSDTNWISNEETEYKQF